MDLYNILSLLGKGTFGTVHLCTKKHNNQKIVVKCVRNINLNDERMTAALNEVAILKSLNHPNIIEFHDSCVKDGNLYIVMEYGNKGTLYEMICKTKPRRFSPQTVMNFFCQILMGLNHIHSKNVIHRDLKSENIFITGEQSDVIKIGDFGISKILIPEKNAQTVIGTCNYVAPEVCDGKPYGIKSDIWSLGCILYELCEMERMFDGPIANVVLSIYSGRRKQINVNYYGLQIHQMIELMLEMDPDDRPDTLKLMSLTDVFPSLYALQTTLGCLLPTAKFDFEKN